MICWKALKKKLIELRWVKKINESELSCQLKNGSTISLKGSDNPDALRGVSLSYLVIDEVADCDEELFYEVLRPALADQQGGAMFIGTPKGKNNWSYDLYCLEQQFPEQWKSFQYTTLEGGFVKPEEIESARREMSERQFRQEFLATFETYEGRVAWAFEREKNVKKIENAPTDVLHVGIDFNVQPITASITVRQGDTLYAIDEIVIYSSNTNELCDEIKARYPRSKIFAYPDPSGSARRTSAGGHSDHSILSNAGFIVKAPRKHDPVKDRINAFNARLCDSMGIRHLFVDPKCKYTIESLEKFCYKEGTQIPDKDSGFDHIFDAISYAVAFLFPIRRDYGEIEQPRRWTHSIA
jgi:phage terminase large subunit